MLTVCMTPSHSFHVQQAYWHSTTAALPPMDNRHCQSIGRETFVVNISSAIHFTDPLHVLSRFVSYETLYK